MEAGKPAEGMSTDALRMDVVGRAGRGSLPSGCRFSMAYETENEASTEILRT